MVSKPALSAAIAVSLFAAEAHSQNRAACAPRDTVVQRLSDKFGESRRSIGIGNNNTLIELFASDDSGSWTITATNTAGTTCLIASGQAFETLTDPVPVAGTDL